MAISCLHDSEMAGNGPVSNDKVIVIICTNLCNLQWCIHGSLLFLCVSEDLDVCADSDWRPICGCSLHIHVGVLVGRRSIEFDTACTALVVVDKMNELVVGWWTPAHIVVDVWLHKHQCFLETIVKAYVWTHLYWTVFVEWRIVGGGSVVLIHNLLWDSC